MGQEIIRRGASSGGEEDFARPDSQRLSMAIDRQTHPCARKVKWSIPLKKKKRLRAVLEMLRIYAEIWWGI